MNLIEPKICAWCREPFTPDRYRVETQQCCSGLCARRHGGLKRRGQPVQHGLNAIQKRAADRMAGIVADRFGLLSAREQEIFKFARQYGYDQGYNAGMRPIRQKPSDSGGVAA